MDRLLILTDTEINDVARRAATAAVTEIREDLEKARTREIMSKQELAEYLGFSIATVNRLIAAGLPTIRIFDHPRFRKCDVDAWIERRN